MERKSIGTLIAALRRANGMTQKELAERLNVSDKAVSRWERDESLPDLTLLPLIADIFHITVDELLRGERKSATAAEALEDSAAEQARLRKQTKRVTNAAMTRLRGRLLATVCVGLLALLGAVICNFGFSRMDMAALVGLLIWAGAAAMLAVFTASALHGAEDDEYSAEEVRLYRLQVIAWGKGIGYILLGVLAMLLPFLLFMIDTAAQGEYIAFGSLSLQAGSWFRWSLLCGAALSLCAVCALYFMDGVLLKRGLYPGATRRTLLGVLAGVLAAVMLITGFVGGVISARTFGAYLLGETFDNFEDFKIFCESMIETPYQTIELTDEQATVIIDGRELTEEEWRNEYYLNEVLDEEGNLIGRFDGTGIASWTWSKAGDQMTFTAYTYADQAAAKTRYDAAQSTVGILFMLEPLVALIVWLIVKDTKKKPNLRK